MKLTPRQAAGWPDRKPIALIALLAISATTAPFQAQLMWATNRNGTITIIGGCPGSSGAVTIPETINGRPVTQIEDWAFAQCSSLASLPLVNGVVSFTDPEWTNHPTRVYRVRKQ